jgi:hypothetical protein
MSKNKKKLDTHTLEMPTWALLMSASFNPVAYTNRYAQIKQAKYETVSRHGKKSTTGADELWINIYLPLILTRSIIRA